VIETAAFLGLGGLVGLCLGSFTATAAIRMTRAEQAVAGRSHCDTCGTPLSFSETLPVAAFVRLGGACGACGERIDPLHLVGELGGAAIVVSAVVVSPEPRAAVLVALGLALLATSIVDAKTHKLPDLFTVAIAVLGLVASFQRSTFFALTGLAAAAVAFVVLEAARRAFLALRGKPGLGFGDVKLISAIALWLGLTTPWAVVVAAGLGLVASRLVQRADDRMAFGPFIAIGSFLIGLLQEVYRWPTLA
jgi:leader peptidase (prepilin peptidase) / N-methyltransferase